jgi:hypothetical protein
MITNHVTPISATVVTTVTFIMVAGTYMVDCVKYLPILMIVIACMMLLIYA